MLKEQLKINEWLELIKEDKNLNGAYICISQYLYLVEEENQQLKIQISAREEEYKKLEILVECLKLGVTLNQEQEELLDKILFKRGVSE